MNVVDFSGDDDMVVKNTNMTKDTNNNNCIDDR